MDEPTFIEIPGKPFAKQRARVGKWGAYTPKPTVDHEADIAARTKDAFAEPLEGPVSVEIRAIFEPPKSWTKKKTQELLWRAHTQRPDLDNVAKSILDGMNGIAFNDDSQVADLRVIKLWGAPAKTLVRIEGLAG